MLHTCIRSASSQSCTVYLCRNASSIVFLCRLWYPIVGIYLFMHRTPLQDVPWDWGNGPLLLSGGQAYALCVKHSKVHVEYMPYASGDLSVTVPHLSGPTHSCVIATPLSNHFAVQYATRFKLPGGYSSASAGRTLWWCCCWWCHVTA